MAEEKLTASFAGGALRLPAKVARGAEVALAVPLCRVVAAILRIGGGEGENIADAALAKLKAISPFPDESPAVSCETLRETEDSTVVLAAALPKDSSEDIAASLDEAGVNVKRVDIAALGVLRGAWGQISAGGAGGEGGAGRRIVAIEEEDDIALFVMDGDCPVALRAISREGDARRDTMLALLKAEDFAGGAPVAECVILGGKDSGALDAALASFASVRRMETAPDAVETGVGERSAEAGGLDVMPASWRETLEETRFKRSMRKYLAVSLSILALAVAAAAGGPFVYGYMASNVETQRKTHRSAYNKVNEKRRQVESVRSVSNHDLGALEALRVVSSVMPDGVTLSKWNFKRGDRLSFSGTVEDGDQQKVYNFKDGLAGVMLSQISENEDDAETPFFAEVTLPRGVVQRGSKTMFDVDCFFKTEEDADR